LNGYLKAVLTGSGRCYGNPLLRAGTSIVVPGLGARFGGALRVSSVTHSFSPSAGYRTSFQLMGSRQ
jgi:phage protein D